MRRKKARDTDHATFCRSYLVTLGLFFLATGVFAIVRDGLDAATWPWWAFLVLGAFLLGGLVLVLFGLLGPEEKMEAWAEASSTHDASLVFMALAYPVYLMLAPAYNKRR